jgi:hypothetical protein
MKFNSKLRFRPYPAAGFLGGMIVLVCGTTAVAVVFSGQSLDLDFTSPDIVKQVSWTPTRSVKLGSNGLFLDLPSRMGIGQFQLQTTEPLALGVYWQAVRGASIWASLTPVDTGQAVLFVRYSVDAKHWSTWQSLSRPSTESRCLPTYPQCQVFTGELAVPHQQSEEFDQLCGQYASQHRGEVTDEEECAQWIVQSQPDFFATHLPVIGYVQFLYEKRMLSGGERIEHLNFHLGFAYGSNFHDPGHAPPGTPWRFRAP